MNKIAIDPLDLSNTYIVCMKNAYESIGVNVIAFNIHNINDIDYVMLNWFENIDGNILKQIKLFCKKLLILFVLIVKRKRIVWTMHNKRPHRKSNKKQLYLLSKIIILLLKCFSYKVIVHAKQEKEIKINHAKTVIVPHPNSVNVYGDCIENNFLSNNKLKLLFFGETLLYKNLDILIETVRELNFEDIELLIAGKISGDYKIVIENMIGSYSNIKTNFSYIPDSEIPELFANCHLLVMPLDIESCINSSTVILAFSYMRSVLCSRIGTLYDINDPANYFSYSYKERAEHKEQLKKAICFIHDTYKDNYNELLNLGQECYKSIVKNNSIEKISLALKNIFS